MNAFARWIIMGLFGLVAMQAHAQYDAGETFVCKSIDFRQNYCAADTHGGVTMVRQISDAACIQSRTWGYDGRGVWVTQGCAAEFERRAPEEAQTIRCASSGYRQNYCRIDTRGGVRLLRQISDSACIRGRSWDFDGRGVWVSNGCEADFEVGGYVERAPPPPPVYIERRIVRCESINDRTERCNLDTRGGVRLVTQLSNSGCYRNRSWGADRDGIWVSNGCRADFEVGGYSR